MTLVYYILHTQSAALAFKFIPFVQNFEEMTTTMSLRDDKIQLPIIIAILQNDTFSFIVKTILPTIFETF